MSKKIRWGIMSTAQIGENRLIPAIRKSATGEVVAVASRDLAKATEFARKLDIPQAFGSYEALLACPDVDAIYCPLPTGMHKEWCLKSAAAGKPMLCEKPLCVNREDAETVFRAFDAAGLLISEAYMYLFHPRNQRVRELVQSGAIGQLRSIEATFHVALPRSDIRYRPELGGGAVLDLGCYCVGIARLIAGCEPTQVKALAHIGSESGVDETFVGCLEFPEQVFATFACSMTTAFDCRYTVYGTDGMLRIGRGGMIAWPGESFEIEIIKGDEREVVVIEDCDHYALLVEAFNQAMLKGEKQVVPHAESLANLDVLDRLRASL
ncbi:MAG: Gfo/Idh/MocA family oxidoreductase [Puniceicoccaceae bacterium]